jgi:ATP-dependent Clp protease adapter protein ClpS
MLKGLLRFVLSRLDDTTAEGIIQEYFPHVNLWCRDLSTTATPLLIEELDTRGYRCYKDINNILKAVTTDTLIEVLKTREFDLNDREQVSYLQELGRILTGYRGFLVFESKQEIVEYLKKEYPNQFFETPLEAIEGIERNHLGTGEVKALLNLISQLLLSVEEIKSLLSSQLRKHGYNSISRSNLNKELTALFVSNGLTDAEIVDLLRNYFTPRSNNNVLYAVVLKNDNNVSAEYVVETLLAKTGDEEYNRITEQQRCRDLMMKARTEGEAILTRFLYEEDARRYCEMFSATDLTVVVEKVTE